MEPAGDDGPDVMASLMFVIRGATVRRFQKGKLKGGWKPNSTFMSMLATDRAVQWAGGSQPELVLSVSGDLFGTDFQGAEWLDANLSEEAKCFSITCSTERCGPVAALPSPRTRRPSGDRAWQPRRVPARGLGRREGAVDLRHPDYRVGQGPARQLVAQGLHPGG